MTEFSVEASDVVDSATLDGNDFTVNGVPADDAVLLGGGHIILFTFSTSPVIPGATQCIFLLAVLTVSRGRWLSSPALLLTFRTHLPQLLPQLQRLQVQDLHPCRELVQHRLRVRSLLTSRKEKGQGSRRRHFSPDLFSTGLGSLTTVCGVDWLASSCALTSVGPQ